MIGPGLFNKGHDKKNGDNNVDYVEDLDSTFPHEGLPKNYSIGITGNKSKDMNKSPPPESGPCHLCK